MDVQVFRDREKSILATFEVKVDVILTVFHHHGMTEVALQKIKAAHEHTREAMKSLHSEFLNSDKDKVVEDPFVTN
jgi:hypothetical protein